MIDEGFCPFTEDLKFSNDQFGVIVRAGGAVTGDVTVQTTEHGLAGTGKYAEQYDADESVDVPGLAGMTGDAVQNENITFNELIFFEKAINDLLGKREMIVFEEKAPIKDTTDEFSFSDGETIGRREAGRKRTKLGSKIQMMAATAPKTVLRK